MEKLTLASLIKNIKSLKRTEEIVDVMKNLLYPIVGIDKNGEIYRAGRYGETYMDTPKIDL